MTFAEGPRPTLLYQVKQIELAIRGQLDRLVRRDGITVAQYTALTVLERRAGLTAVELARSSFITTQAVADVVVSLEHQGLVTRRPDPSDRRRALIDLTADGREILDDLRAPVTALEAHMVRALDARRLGEFRRTLDDCHAALRSLQT